MTSFASPKTGWLSESGLRVEAMWVTFAESDRKTADGYGLPKYMVISGRGHLPGGLGKTSSNFQEMVGLSLLVADSIHWAASSEPLVDLGKPVVAP